MKFILKICPVEVSDFVCLLSRFSKYSTASSVKPFQSKGIKCLNTSFLIFLPFNPLLNLSLHFFDLDLGLQPKWGFFFEHLWFRSKELILKIGHDSHFTPFQIIISYFYLQQQFSSSIWICKNILSNF